jgi:hypothetical protein
MQGIAVQLQGIQRQIEDFKLQSDYRDRERVEIIKALSVRVDALERRQWMQAGVVGVFIFAVPLLCWFLIASFA